MKKLLVAVRLLRPRPQRQDAELKQPLSARAGRHGQRRGQGEWFDFADTAAPAVRGWRRARPWRGKPSRAGQALALVCGKMELAKDTLSFSRAAAAVAEREAALKNALAAFYQGKPTDAKVATLAINICMYAQERRPAAVVPATRWRARPSRRSSWSQTRTPACACARPAWT